MIVLAGGIGSGKSVVARILRLKGFGVYDCDFEAKRLMNSDKELMGEVEKIAGETVYADGKLDRKKLASIIFSDETKRRRINSVVHSAVRRDVERWLAKDAGNIFVETAIAAESGIDLLADAVWIVWADERVRIARVEMRDGRAEDEILKIIQSQAEEEKRILKCGREVVMINNNPDSQLLAQIDKALENKKL